MFLVVIMKDDLSNFLASKKTQQNDEIKAQVSSESSQKVNLIEEAEKESEALSSNIGRPKKAQTEKANQRVVGYITEQEKEQFNDKRGLVSESKIISALITKWLQNEVDI